MKKDTVHPDSKGRVLVTEIRFLKIIKPSFRDLSKSSLSDLVIAGKTKISSDFTSLCLMVLNSLTSRDADCVDVEISDEKFCRNFWEAGEQNTHDLGLFSEILNIR